MAPKTRTLADVVRRQRATVLPPTATAREVAVAIATDRTDAAAICDAGRSRLLGIVTVKDLARSLSRGAAPEATPATDVMTPGPCTMGPDGSPEVALATMQAGGYRHMPIVGRGGELVGIADVLGLAFDAVACLQAAYEAGVPTRRAWSVFRAAREGLARRTLGAVVDDHPSTRSFVSLLPTDSVRAGCAGMAAAGASAAVLVEGGKLVGIFSGRDAVTRVVARGVDPDATPVGAVATADPDAATVGDGVLESLIRMQAHGYRQLPVVSAHGDVIALVDVLLLAVDALEHARGAGGGAGRLPPASSLVPSTSLSTLSPAPSVAGGMWDFLFPGGGGVGVGRSMPDRGPPASAGARGGRDDGRFAAPPRAGAGGDVSGRRGGGLAAADTPPGYGGFASVLPRSGSGVGSDSGTAGNAIPVASFVPRSSSLTSVPPSMGMYGDVGAVTGTSAVPPLVSSVLTFKFTDSAGEYRRVKLPTSTAVGCYDRLLGEVRRRYGAPAGSELKLKFKDEDGDDVVLGCDEDLAECLSVAADAGLKIMPLQVSRTTAPVVASPAATAAAGVEAVSASTPPSLSSTAASSAGVDLASELAAARRNVSALEEQVHVATHRRSMSLSRGVPAPTNRRPLSTATRLSTVTTPSATPPVPSTASSSPLAAPAPSADDHATAGNRALHRNDVDGALAAYAAALALQPDCVLALAGRGAARLILNDAAAAEADYRAALAALDGDASDGGDGVSSSGRRGPTAASERDAVLGGLAEALIELRRYEEAVAVTAPASAAARATVGAALEEEVASAEAAGSQAAAEGAHGDATAVYTAGLRVAEAAAAGGLAPSGSGGDDVADAWQPRRVALLLGRAAAYASLGDIACEREDVEAAVAGGGGGVPARVALARCLWRAGETDRARVEARRAGDLDATNSQVISLHAELGLPPPTDGAEEETAAAGDAPANGGDGGGDDGSGGKGGGRADAEPPTAVAAAAAAAADTRQADLAKLGAALASLSARSKGSSGGGGGGGGGSGVGGRGGKRRSRR